jgi:hypothetical protein
MSIKLLGIIGVDCDVTEQPPVVYSAFMKCWIGMGI